MSAEKGAGPERHTGTTGCLFGLQTVSAVYVEIKFAVRILFSVLTCRVTSSLNLNSRSPPPLKIKFPCFSVAAKTTTLNDRVTFPLVSVPVEFRHGRDVRTRWLRGRGGQLFHPADWRQTPGRQTAEGWSAASERPSASNHQVGPPTFPLKSSSCSDTWTLSGTMGWRWSQERPGSFPAWRCWRRTETPPPLRSSSYWRAFPSRDCFSSRLVLSQAVMMSSASFRLSFTSLYKNLTMAPLQIIIGLVLIYW